MVTCLYPDFFFTRLYIRVIYMRVNTCYWVCLCLYNRSVKSMIITVSESPAMKETGLKVLIYYVKLRLIFSGFSHTIDQLHNDILQT